MHLILWPMKSPDAPHLAWEVPARAYGSPTLFRWWAGEQPRDAHPVRRSASCRRQHHLRKDLKSATVALSPSASCLSSVCISSLRPKAPSPWPSGHRARNWQIVAPLVAPD